ncbi:uncharacterized protein si:ch211-171b20.3 isoform X2 [Clupea harengus]|uniref:Uncharacterized protein si:ch211-171b20.3 isoform X2 n=1 Tax=Clupea harengus TaxID=7950 RepID=A0A6P8GK93_CLUHA|nr:uncharacterized protein si:ch211-171b20.3 isoform X2 [Clupea harengus]
MYTFPSPKQPLRLPASLGNRDHDINSHYLPLHCESSYAALAQNYYGNLRLYGNLLEPKKKYPIQNYEMYLKPATVVYPLPRTYQVQKSNNLHRFSQCRQTSNRSSKPFCPFEGYDITSVPTRRLTASSTVSGKSFSVEVLKHRSRISNRTCSLFTIGANQRSQSYPDPAAGAASSFIHRLSEISSLEGETVRQEKIRKLRKSRKQD